MMVPNVVYKVYRFQKEEKERKVILLLIRCVCEGGERGYKIQSSQNKQTKNVFGADNHHKIIISNSILQKK
jgi:hydrogenase maturation factor